MTRSLRILAVLAMGAMTASGCTSTTGGTPGPSDAGATTSPRPSESASPELPPRPRDINLDRLDPCSLWTADQLIQLALDATPIGGGPRTRATGEASCAHTAAADTPPRVGFHLALVLGRDASDAFGGDGATLTTVDGFPALQEVGEGLRPCTLAVSTTQGQYLEVRLDYGSSSASGFLPVQQACELTSKAATFAMQTLQKQR